MADDNRMDRRQLVKSLVVTSTSLAVPSLAVLNVSADDKAADNKPADDAKQPPDLPSEEVLLLSYIVQRYPSDHYDETALRGIHGDLRGDVARSRILSEFRILNSDEPCLMFRAFRSPDQ